MTTSMDERLILALDAAGATCSVALGVAGAGGVAGGHRILASRKADLRHGHAAILVPMVDEVMRAAGTGLQALAGIAVGIGPGSFTGLRIALAAARGFGLALARPVIGITNFQAAAANLPQDVRRGSVRQGSVRQAHPGGILVLIDSRREEPYVASLDDDLLFRAAPRFMTPLEIAVLIETVRPAIVTGDGLDLWPGDLPPTTRRIAAAADAEAILRLAADPSGRFGQKAAPLYLRAPDAALPKAG